LYLSVLMILNFSELLIFRHLFVYSITNRN
jgi:hypothetical protein